MMEGRSCLRLEAAHLDSGEVRKQVLPSIIRGYESIPLGVVEPLYRTCWHRAFLFEPWNFPNPAMPVLLRSRATRARRPHGGQTQGSLLRVLGGDVKYPKRRQLLVLPARLRPASGLQASLTAAGQSLPRVRFGSRE